MIKITIKIKDQQNGRCQVRFTPDVKNGYTPLEEATFRKIKAAFQASAPNGKVSTFNG